VKIEKVVIYKDRIELYNVTFDTKRVTKVAKKKRHRRLKYKRWTAHDDAKLMEYLTNNPEISRNELAKIFGVSVAAIYNRITHLRKKVKQNAKR